MLKVVPGSSIPSIKRQIITLKWVIRNDTNEKDKLIHTEALKELKAKLKELEP